MHYLTNEERQRVIVSILFLNKGGWIFDSLRVINERQLLELYYVWVMNKVENYSDAVNLPTPKISDILSHIRGTDEIQNTN